MEISFDCVLTHLFTHTNQVFETPSASIRLILCTWLFQVFNHLLSHVDPEFAQNAYANPVHAEDFLASNLHLSDLGHCGNYFIFQVVHLLRLVEK